MQINLDLIFILFAIIIILAIVISKIVRHYKIKIKVLNHIYEDLRRGYQELNEQKKKLEKENEIKTISLVNLSNALNFTKPKDGKRHIFVCSINQDQQIVLIFDEEYHYIPEYFDQHPLIDKEPYISTRTIDCTVFIDGNTFDPLLMDPICQGDTCSEIKDMILLQKPLLI